MVIALAGRRIDAPDGPPRFPAANIALVTERLRKLFRTERATAVVSSAACGADLIALREAGTLNARRRVVLPFGRQEFRASSVTDRPGDWGDSFDRIIDEVSEAGGLSTLSGRPNDDAAYAAANAAILDRAQALGRETGQDVCAVVVWDGKSRGPDDLTDAFAQAARERGWRVLEVLTLRTCFVVQGFGEKTDLSTGRVLDLDASYEVLKEAVEEAGLRCVRADEIKHSGLIDKPMYEWLYHADLVIADLSTYNVNAAYELGVRYGVRPSTTMIVAENQFKNPFDVGHIVTLPYEHLGKDIGRKEASRFKAVLVERIRSLLAQPKADSPVYAFLPLSPPVESEESAMAYDASVAAPQRAAANDATSVSQPPAPDTNANALLTMARAALAADRFVEAKELFLSLHAIRPRDGSVIQQLALATYKSKLPYPLTALKEAHSYLQALDPESTNDPETLGLWGAVHKRLWDLSAERRYLDEAIASYERGFFLKQDYYNGINLAFLMDVRASLVDSGSRVEAVADAVLARRVRRQVLVYCDRALAAATVTAAAIDKYWIMATKWEAAVGLEDASRVAEYRAEAERMPVAEWMLNATRSQVNRLEQLLAASPLRSSSSGM